MRRLVVIALLTLATQPSVALAAETNPPTDANPNQDRTGVVITNPGQSAPGDSGGSTSRGGRRRSGGGGRSAPRYRVERFELINPPEGRCLERVVSYRDTPMTPEEEQANVANRAGAANIGVPPCDPNLPYGSDPAAVAAPAPDEVAEAFVREIPLPAPVPSIAPNGTAITGLAAFVETNGSLGHSVGPSPTPLGPIVVEATSTYYVDWGDGTPETGPFAFEGEAYPTGRIWHHYRYRGDYTVTVRQAWSANWRLGPDAGTVGGLQTEASVALDVDEVQAVIRR